MKNKGKKIITAMCLLGLVFGATNFTKDIKAKEDAYMEGTDHQFMYNKQDTQYNIARGKDKYYMIKSGYLYCADKDDMQFKVLCSKPECEHNVSKTIEQKMECGGYTTSTFIAYYNGDLYITSRDYSKGGDKLDLVKLSLDGKNKETIFTFDKTPISMAIHRGELYYSIRDDIKSTDSMYKERYILNKIKLGDDKAIELYKGNIDREEVIEDITCYGKYIYFTVRSYKDDEITSKQMYYDAINNTIERIHSDDDKDIVRDVKIAGDKIIYSVCNIISKDDFTYKDYMANLDGSNVEESFTNKVKARVDGDGENFILEKVNQKTWDVTGIQIYTPEGELILNKDIKDYDGTSRFIPGDKDYMFIIQKEFNKHIISSVDKATLKNGEFEEKCLFNDYNYAK